MNYLSATLASLAIAFGVLGTLMILVVAMACGANSTPEQIRQIKLIMLASAIGGLACFGVGVMLLAKGFPWWAGFVGGLPMIVVGVTMVWLTLRTVR